MCTVQLVWWTGNYFGTPCMLHIYTTKVRGLWYSSNFWCKQRSFVTQHTKMVVHNISLTLWPLLPFNYNAMRVYFCVPRYWPSFAMKIIEKRVINAWTLPFKMILILCDRYSNKDVWVDVWSVHNLHHKVYLLFCISSLNTHTQKIEIKAGYWIRIFISKPLTRNKIVREHTCNMQQQLVNKNLR